MPTGRRPLAFGHENEVALAHYYSVTFDNGVRAEIAPADHAAMLRFTLPGTTATLLFDNIDEQAAVEVDQRSGAVTAYSDVRSQLSNGATRMFVYATFDAPIVASGRPGGVAGRERVAGFARFDISGPAGRVVTMRIATSLISLDQARANLAAEIAPADSFDDVRERARLEWDDRLATIEVEGASHDQLVTLYSSLYRLFLYPNSAYENVGTAAAPVFAHAVQSSVGTPPSTATRTGPPSLPARFMSIAGSGIRIAPAGPLTPCLLPAFAENSSRDSFSNTVMVAGFRGGRRRATQT